MDQFRQLRTGEQLPGLPRQPWNAMLEKLKGDRTGGPYGSPTGGPVEILVFNATGDVIPRFGILRPTEPHVTFSQNEEIFYEQDVMIGEAPAAGKAFCVLQEAAPPGGFALARVAGLTRALVNLTDTAHEFARPTASTDQLTSDGTGPARVLWVESDETTRATGSQWAVVLIGDHGRDETAMVVVTSTLATIGLYPAIRKNQVGRVADWTDADACWLEPTNGFLPDLGTPYFARRNVDQFMGKDVWATRDCCSRTGSEPACFAPHVSPDMVCVTFDANGTALDGFQILLTGGNWSFSGGCGSQWFMAIWADPSTCQWGTAISIEGSTCLEGFCPPLLGCELPAPFVITGGPSGVTTSPLHLVYTILVNGSVAGTMTVDASTGTGCDGGGSGSGGAGGGTTTSDCDPGVAIPQVLDLDFTVLTGTCTDLAGTKTLRYDGYRWLARVTIGGKKGYFVFYCDKFGSGGWVLSGSADDGTWSLSPSLVGTMDSTDPLQVTFTGGSIAGGTCNGVTLTAVVTEP